MYCYGCIDYAGAYVMVYPCHGMKGNQEWIYGTVCRTIVSLLDCILYYYGSIDYRVAWEKER